MTNRDKKPGASEILRELRGELSEAELAELRALEERDPDAAADFERDRELLGILKEIGTPVHRAPAGFTDRVLRATAPQSLSERLIRFGGRWGSVVCMTLVAGGLGYAVGVSGFEWSTVDRFSMWLQGALGIAVTLAALFAAAGHAWRGSFVPSATFGAVALFCFVLRAGPDIHPARPGEAARSPIQQLLDHANGANINVMGPVVTGGSASSAHGKPMVTPTPVPTARVNGSDE